MKRGFVLFFMALLTACGSNGGSSTPVNTTKANSRVVTNLLLYSNDLTRSTWGHQSGATSPTANKIVKNGSPGASATQAVKVAGTSVMALVHARAGSLSRFVMTLYNVTTAQRLTAASYPLTADYKPYQLTASDNILPGDTIKLYLYPSDSSDSAVGDIDIENASLIDITTMTEPQGNIEVIATAAQPITSHYSYSNDMINISCWGDSLTEGSYPRDIGRILAASRVYNGGVGGETSSQIKSRFLAAPDKFGDLTIIWAGRNNYHDPATVTGDVAEMVSRLTSNRYIILPVLNGDYANEYAGQADYNTIMQLNSVLAAQYPGHYLDVRSAVIEAFNPSLPQDVTDHANDVTPSSLRRDNIHLNGSGYQIVAEIIYGFIVSKGWDIPAQTPL